MKTDNYKIEGQTVTSLTGNTKGQSIYMTDKQARDLKDAISESCGIAQMKECVDEVCDDVFFLQALEDERESRLNREWNQTLSYARRRGLCLSNFENI